MMMKRKTGFICTISFILILAAVCETMAQRGTVVRLKQSDSMDAPFAQKVELYTSSYALVIGIDAYKHWPRLTNAVKDAERVANVLEKMNFEVDLQKNLKAADLESVFRSFFIRKGSQKNARLFVWFAGHGHTINGEGFLVPADAPSSADRLAFKEKALPMRRFGEYMRLADSKHVYAVFDSCFSGAIFNVARSSPPAAITRVTAQPVRQYLSSGDAGQQVSDDGTFRKLFISALQAEEPADANKDGYLTASELGMFITDRLSNLTNSRQRPRYGKMRDMKYDKGDFVFVLPTQTRIPSNQVTDFDDIFKWMKWQQARNEEYQNAIKIDESSYVSAKGKVLAWKRFMTAVAGDNPFSQDDDEMRKYAATRVSHWQNVANEKPNPTKPIATKPDAAETGTNIKEIKRDGRFIAYNNGTVKDTQTGLIWAAKDNGKDINWQDAKKYCENYKGGGCTDWRIPTIDELEGIYDSENSYPTDCNNEWKVHTTKLIHISCWWVWASYIRGSEAAIFYFNGGVRYWVHQSVSMYYRVLPVRGGKRQFDYWEFDPLTY